ncbi:MAG: GNAT family N-acetyltransferase [Actinomycetota bacterium]|nr:GNAT family N-acetyltransferase [Actinomycetota bacterium]
MSGLRRAASIATERLVLDPLRVEDADEMVTVLGDPALHEFTGGRPATLDELRVRYAALMRGSGSATELWLNWVVRCTTDAAAVGTVQATVLNPDSQPSALVAWTIGSPWQGRGYAGEAALGLVHWLKTHGVAPIVAHVHPDHKASAAVAAGAGLQVTSDVVDGETVWRM